MTIDFQRGETHLFLGLYEIELNKHLRRIATPGCRSFDIGGQHGYDALLLAKLTGAPVVSVECEPDLAAEMRRNAAANPGSQITVVEGFAGSDSGEGRVTVDELARDHFAPDVVKMDIEGTEVEALQGAEQTLTEHRPALLLEVHGTDVEWECLGLLRHAGYAPPTVIEPRKWLPDQRPMAHNRWLVFDGR